MAKIAVLTHSAFIHDSSIISVHPFDFLKCNRHVLVREISDVDLVVFMHCNLPLNCLLFLNFNCLFLYDKLPILLALFKEIISRIFSVFPLFARISLVIVFLFFIFTFSQVALLLFREIKLLELVGTLCLLMGLLDLHMHNSLPGNVGTFLFALLYPVILDTVVQTGF